MGWFGETYLPPPSACDTRDGLISTGFCGSHGDWFDYSYEDIDLPDGVQEYCLSLYQTPLANLKVQGAITSQINFVFDEKKVKDAYANGGGVLYQATFGTPPLRIELAPVPETGDLGLIVSGIKLQDSAGYDTVVNVAVEDIDEVIAPDQGRYCSRLRDYFLKRLRYIQRRLLELCNYCNRS